MARETSAGVLAYRLRRGAPEFLLVHPGGPYWARKDAAGWSIPKGLVEAGEEGWAAAQREFCEELGPAVTAGLTGTPEPLAPCPTPGGKLVIAWLVAADLDLTGLSSNVFEIEWPPRSGRRASFPEVDRAGYFDAETALWKIHKGQRPMLHEAIERLQA